MRYDGAAHSGRFRSNRGAKTTIEFKREIVWQSRGESVPVYPFEGKLPVLGEGTWIAPCAVVAGDVTTGRDVSFWFQTVTRGDVHRITIGEETNIQDGSVLHVTHQTHPLHIGPRVVVGHSAVLHGCTVEESALIGIGARVLDGAVIEAGAQIGAGAVVSPGARIPAGQLALGVPARVVRKLSDEELRANGEICSRYLDVKRKYLEMGVGQQAQANCAEVPEEVPGADHG